MKLVELYRYPIKSAAAQSIRQAHFGPLGLEGDRQRVLASPDGRFVTARECPRLARIYWVDSTLEYCGQRSPAVTFAGEDQVVSVWKRTQSGVSASAAVNDWLSDVLEQPVTLLQLPSNESQHYGDSQPVMVLFRETAQRIERALGRPFSALQLRPNLVIDGGEAFTEKTLTTLQVGSVTLAAVEPCTRCKMINLAPDTEVYPRPLDVSSTLMQLQPGFVAGHHFAVASPGHCALGDSIQ